jgi:hypothetical protein
MPLKYKVHETLISMIIFILSLKINSVLYTLFEEELILEFYR